MAGRVECLDGDLTHGPSGIVSGHFADLVAIFAADYRHTESLQHLGIAASMVTMVVGVDNCRQFDVASVGQGLQHREHLGWVGGINDDSFLGRAVGDNIGVVIARALPHGNALNLHACSVTGGESRLEKNRFGCLPGVSMKLADGKAHQDDEKESGDGFGTQHLRDVR